MSVVITICLCLEYQITQINSLSKIRDRVKGMTIVSGNIHTTTKHAAGRSC